jgi:SAM-dependent methyltransferase
VSVEHSGQLQVKSPDLNPAAASSVCPACGGPASGKPLETFHGASLIACARCEVQFWHPVVMPDAAWYETAYQGRDRTAMPLEPGHRFFLADPKAPKRGRLLDLGCGIGNFLSAARDAGFDATGIEFDPSAVRFARQHYGLEKVFALRPEEFRAANPRERFDVVTFFEVLEHQENPRRFLNVAKELLTEDGYLGLSVPNRCRWQKGVDSLDYPPNHLTRWSPAALGNFLRRNGFEVLSMRQEPLGIRRAALVLSMGLRTGLVSRVAGERPPMLADLAEMNPEEMQRTVKRLEEDRGHRMAARLVRWKNLAMVPLAALLLPYLRLRGYTGLYLYCLARRKRSASPNASRTVMTSAGAA